jgi:hypothetical protein
VDDDNDRAGDRLSATFSRSVTIADDDTTPPDVAFNEPRGPSQVDESPTPFEWTITPHTSKMEVVVKRNGAVIHTRTLLAGQPGWTANNQYSYDYGSELGTYEATGTVRDDDDDRKSDSLSATATRSIVTVDDDTTAPVVTFTEPRAATLADGGTEPFHCIVGPDSASTHVVVTRNGVVVHDRTVTAGQAAWAADGQYTYDYGNELGAYVTTVSGNLPLAYAAHVPGCQIWAADLSVEAVEFAKRNALQAGLGHVQFRQGDLFAPFDSEEFWGRMDMITCNPPYISAAKVSQMHPEISGHEARMAFDGGAFGISILSRLLNETTRFLKSGGWLGFEVGLGQGPGMAKRMAAMTAFTGVETHTDAEGNVRGLFARMN